MLHNREYPSVRTRQGAIQAFGAGALLVTFLCACNFATSLPTATPQPDLTSWTETKSPLFPVNWPPTSDTVWISYTFAYGRNPTTLMDGAYVTYPLSKTEWKGGISTSIELSRDMTQAAVQGMVPLDSETSKILENEKQVAAICLKMTELPDLNMPETKEMLAYYHAWFKYNNAFLELIRKDHPAFIEWISTN
jgi:hypothetical protein